MRSIPTLKSFVVFLSTTSTRRRPICRSDGISRHVQFNQLLLYLNVVQKTPPIFMACEEKQALPELKAWEREPCIMGIDEAGRGPVLGAMVYGGAWYIYIFPPFNYHLQSVSVNRQVV